MKAITTTELRTRSKELVKTLKEGKTVDLIHRSKIIGVFEPVFEAKKILTKREVDEIGVMLDKIRPARIISSDKRKKVYKARLKKEYGKSVSGHKHPDRYLGA